MKEMSNKELETVLPDIRNMLKSLEDGSFVDYEKKLNEATNKAIGVLEDVIEDGTLQLDLEQTVNAVSVLTKAKASILESKRKLIETCIKGEVMIKALEDKPGKDKESSVLLDYLERNNLDKTLDSTGTAPGSSSSIFESISNQNEE